MEKKLSELLAEVEPWSDLKSFTVGNYVDRASYDKLKAIAVELAKACEWMRDPDHFHESCLPLLDKTLTTARKMLGDE